MNGKEYLEEDFLPLSALQHLVFCERQCALIHVEKQWRDNPLTLEGSHMHNRVDESAPRRERRGDMVIARGLALRSFELGLSGRADVVEFNRLDRIGVDSPLDSRKAGVALCGFDGRWAPFPVDYKRGKPKTDGCDEVQLCAQSMCLEEMLEVRVEHGALFYGRTKRRQEVAFDGELRSATREAARRLHALVDGGVTPAAMKTTKCRRCSLVETCLPHAMSGGISARSYLDQAVTTAGDLGGGS